MNLAIIVLSVVLPLLPLVLWPARTIGRGGAWKYVGAAMIVGLMMIVFFSVQGLNDIAGSDAANPQLSAADVKALDNLFK